MNENDVLARVKRESREYHERLEALLPIDEHLTLDTYRQILACFWGIVEPIEKSLREVGVPAEVRLHERRRSGLLLQDLAATGLTPHEITQLSRCERVPRLRCQARALGCMYVLEGSALGGQFLARIVKQKLGMDEQSGCSFFLSHGADVSRMWREFCAVVREHVVTPDDQRQFIAGAIDTFKSFLEWMETRNVQVA